MGEEELPRLVQDSALQCKTILKNTSMEGHERYANKYLFDNCARKDCTNDLFTEFCGREYKDRVETFLESVIRVEGITHESTGRVAERFFED